jgi:hypothetical protein
VGRAPDPSSGRALAAVRRRGHRAGVRTVEVSSAQTLARDEKELWVLVVESGSLRQGQFLLAPGDVLVCEGDDPLHLDVAPIAGGAASLALVALHRVDGATLRWVP